MPGTTDNTNATTETQHDFTLYDVSGNVAYSGDFKEGITFPVNGDFNFNVEVPTSSSDSSTVDYSDGLILANSLLVSVLVAVLLCLGVLLFQVFQKRVNDYD